MLCKTGLANVELPLGTENNLAFSNRRFEKWPKRLAAEMNHFDKSAEVFLLITNVANAVGHLQIILPSI